MASAVPPRVRRASPSRRIVPPSTAEAARSAWPTFVPDVPRTTSRPATGQAPFLVVQAASRDITLVDAMSPPHAEGSRYPPAMRCMWKSSIPTVHLRGMVHPLAKSPTASRVPLAGQPHRPGVDPRAEEHIRLLPQVLPLVIARLAVELIRGEVEVTVAGHRQRVGPEHARVVDESLEPAIGSAAEDGVVLVV